MVVNEIGYLNDFPSHSTNVDMELIVMNSINDNRGNKFINI